MATATEVANFINKIAPLIQKYAKQYGYKVASPIIAQACCESAFGTSSLGKKYHNYFGMKCGSSWRGKSVNLKTKEEYKIGTLTDIKANFRAYSSMEEGIKGYFEFISKAIIDLALLNRTDVVSMYVLTELNEVQYNIEVIENYALSEDEEEEKNSDLAEIAANTRSRKSYIKKWRKEELKTDEQIDNELMQIAIENNMFDTLSANTAVQSELDNISAKEEVKKEVDNISVLSE